MKILNTGIYRDGGTREVKTDQGMFYISMPGMGSDVWIGWPGKEGSVIRKDLNERIIELADAFGAGEDHVRSYTYNESQVKTIVMKFAMDMTDLTKDWYSEFHNWFEKSEYKKSDNN